MSQHRPHTPPPEAIDAIAPNFKRRLSGVTATIARLVPLQAREMGVVATGPGLPAHVPHLPLWRVALLPRSAQGRPRWRVWHARRNTEMIGGLVLRHLLGRRLRLLFTSASQRHHTWLSRWLIARMDWVIATSAAGQAYLRVPSEVIMHGIDTSAFAPPASRSSARAALGLPDLKLVGCFGRIRAQKGTDVFIDAMLEVLPQRPDWGAVVLGRATGPHQGFLAGLKAKVARAGLSDRVVFAGEVPVDAIARWYRALDLFIAPQRWEGFGVTPLEAMATGVPVIATTVGAFPELVSPGETGLLVPPGDAQAMARAAAGVMDGKAGLWPPARIVEHARARHDIAGEVAAINAVYRRLLGQGVGR
ncbi:MAG: glycosyltransferase [Alphaproteobacteria bacterium]|nr:MAG: glycosyltransferase [Alphaproteobacteria bacterium]